ncbi:helicase [Escherichia coli]|nr:helicase [Escherichia coli]
MFSHPVYLFLREFSLQDSRGGSLQQYAGRLHREHTGKSDVRIIDFVDTAYPVLLRMWDKRQRGYKAMGYRIVADGEGLSF